MTATAASPVGATSVSVSVPDDVFGRIVAQAGGQSIGDLLSRLLTVGLAAMESPLRSPDDIATLTDPDPVAQARLRCGLGGDLAKAGRDVVPVRDEALIELLARGERPSQVAALARITRAQVARYQERSLARRAELIASGEITDDARTNSTANGTPTEPGAGPDPGTRDPG